MKAPKKPARRPRGRPPYLPTIDQRVTVEQMVFCGESKATIARSLSIDEDTLKKHFVEELENGHANRRKEVIGLMFKAAKDGNVSAQKHLEALGRVAGEGEAVDRRTRPAGPAKVGKKEQQQTAAESVVGKFAPPPAPKLVVSNG